MIARLFFAMRYMSGVCKSFKIFALLGLSTHDQKQCKKYIIGMLEEMLEDLKNENY